MVYSRSVSLPRLAESAPIGQIRLESRVERVWAPAAICQAGAQVLKPVAGKVLAYLSRFGTLMILMDRTTINDTLNLLSVAVSFEGQAFPLGSRGGVARR